MNRKHFSIILIAALVAVCLASGCNKVVRGSGKITTDNREVSSFDKIVLTGAGTLIITQGKKEAVSVEAEDNIVKYVDTRVVRGALQIRQRSAGGLGRLTLLPGKDIVVRITVKDLEKITVNGSGKISMPRLKTDKLELDVSGTAYVKAFLENDETSVEISGSGRIELEGETDKQKIKIDGSAGYVAPEMMSDETSIDISGNGDVEVFAKNKLDVKLSGTGTVIYHGNPKIRQSVSGIGVVKKGTKKDKDK